MSTSSKRCCGQPQSGHHQAIQMAKDKSEGYPNNETPQNCFRHRKRQATTAKETKKKRDESTEDKNAEYNSNNSYHHARRGGGLLAKKRIAATRSLLPTAAMASSCSATTTWSAVIDTARYRKRAKEVSTSQASYVEVGGFLAVPPQPRRRPRGRHDNLCHRQSTNINCRGRNVLSPRLRSLCCRVSFRIQPFMKRPPPLQS